MELSQILRRQRCMKDTLPKNTLIPVLFYNYARPSVEIKFSASFPALKKRTLDNYMESVNQGQLVDRNCSPENSRLQQLTLMFWTTATLPQWSHVSTTTRWTLIRRTFPLLYLMSTGERRSGDWRMREGEGEKGATQNNLAT